MNRLFAALLLLWLSPLLLVIAALIWLFDGRPVFFIQPRVGVSGRMFRICKFRTMRFALGPNLTHAKDKRVTALGRILRPSKLDELPQLWNILRGEMRFIGSRPEVPEFVDDSDLWTRVLANPPGLFDSANVVYCNRHEYQLLAGADDPVTYYREVILPAKLRLSLEYEERRTALGDIWLVARMLRSLLPANPAPVD